MADDDRRAEVECLAARLGAVTRDVFEAPTTVRKQVRERLRKVIVEHLLALVPAPNIRVEVVEEASDPSTGKLAVRVRGNFPPWYVEALRNAGVPVEVLDEEIAQRVTVSESNCEVEVLRDSESDEPSVRLDHGHTDEEIDTVCRTGMCDDRRTIEWMVEVGLARWAGEHGWTLTPKGEARGERARERRDRGRSG